MNLEELIFLGLTLVILGYALWRVVREWRYTSRVLSDLRKEYEQRDADRLQTQIRNLRRIDDEEDV